MKVLVVGSVALDTVKTPSGQAGEVLGGSAVYFSLAASLFVPVNLVAIVGNDFPLDYIYFLKSRDIDVQGLKMSWGQTFRWQGEYGDNYNEARTISTRLNVFKEFKPEVPDDYKKTKFVFLANIDPELQLQVLDQIRKPRLVAGDTMNFWIKQKPEILKKVIRRLDLLFINESEIKLYTGQANLVKAARQIQEQGPQMVMVKRGEYGAMLFNRNSIFWAPAYPTARVVDPTGAGDSFAGAFMGYLTKNGVLGEPDLRKATVMASIIASFNVESFSVHRLKELTKKEIKGRLESYKRMVKF